MSEAPTPRHISGPRPFRERRIALRSRKDALTPLAGTVRCRREPPSLRPGFASPYLPKGGPPVRLVTRDNADTARL